MDHTFREERSDEAERGRPITHSLTRPRGRTMTSGIYLSVYVSILWYLTFFLYFTLPAHQHAKACTSGRGGGARSATPRRGVPLLLLPCHIFGVSWLMARGGRGAATRHLHVVHCVITRFSQGTCHASSVNKLRRNRIERIHHRTLAPTRNSCKCHPVLHPRTCATRHCYAREIIENVCLALDCR